MLVWGSVSGLDFELAVSFSLPALPAQGGLGQGDLTRLPGFKLDRDPKLQTSGAETLHGICGV